MPCVSSSIGSRLVMRTGAMVCAVDFTGMLSGTFSTITLLVSSPKERETLMRILPMML